MVRWRCVYLRPFASCSRPLSLAISSSFRRITLRCSANETVSPEDLSIAPSPVVTQFRFRSGKASPILLSDLAVIPLYEDVRKVFDSPDSLRNRYSVSPFTLMYSRSLDFIVLLILSWQRYAKYNTRTYTIEKERGTNVDRRPSPAVQLGALLLSPRKRVEDSPALHKVESLYVVGLLSQDCIGFELVSSALLCCPERR